MSFARLTIRRNECRTEPREAPCPGSRRGHRLRRRRPCDGRRALGARPGSRRARGRGRRRLLDGRQRRPPRPARRVGTPSEGHPPPGQQRRLRHPAQHRARRGDVAVCDVPGQRRRPAARRGRRPARRGDRRARGGRGRPVRTPGTAVGARSTLAGAPVRTPRRCTAPRAAPAPGPRHALRQQALPHRLPARARHPLPRGPLPVRGRRLHRARAGRGPAHRPGPGPGVRLARAPVRRAAVDLTGPVRRRELAGPYGGVPAGVRGPAGRRAEGTRAGRARQVPRPRPADVPA